MDITILPNRLHGTVSAIASKSFLHRYLICASFADQPTEICCSETSQDIEVTVNCLRNLGVQICSTSHGYRVTPLKNCVKQAVLDCGESGSTLRFLLPVIGALGIEASFVMGGRLPQRPLDPLLTEMRRMGCRIHWVDGRTLRCCGQLHAGAYTIAGGISSQFITGLLFACALLGKGSYLTVTGTAESKPYIDITMRVLSDFGVDVSRPVPKIPVFRSPGVIDLEGDWTCSACFLAANALGSSVNVVGLNNTSCQGDRIVCSLLRQLEQHCVVDASDCPDLVPVLAVVAAAKSGAVFQHTRRLRHKESDRIASILSMLDALGCRANASEDSLTVYPGHFCSTTVNPHGDHRIAMAAAIAATVADGPVTVLDAHCVEKSYSGFWRDYQKLGGIYEQRIW